MVSSPKVVRLTVNLSAQEQHIRHMCIRVVRQWHLRTAKRKPA
jgi:hypothetical protein